MKTKQRGCLPYWRGESEFLRSIATRRREQRRARWESSKAYHLEGTKEERFLETSRVSSPNSLFFFFIPERLLRPSVKKRILSYGVAIDPLGGAEKHASHMSKSPHVSP